MVEEEVNLYHPGGSTAIAEPTSKSTKGSGAQPPDSGSIQWTASEYIEHDRNFSWYLGLIGLTAVVAGLVYLITRDYISTGVIAVLGIIVGMFARRRPQQIDYELNEKGLKIGPKNYSYAVFKSFAMVHDAAVPSINLEPLKRFMPPISIYFAPQDSEPISSLLSAHLPYQEHQPDWVENLAHRLKF